MKLCQGCPHHLGYEQSLWMPAGVKIVPVVIVPIGSFHVDVLWLFSVDEFWRIGFEEICQEDSGPVDDLTPTFNAFELCHEFVAGKLQNIVHGEQETRGTRRKSAVTLTGFSHPPGLPPGVILIFLCLLHHGSRSHLLGSSHGWIDLRVVSLILTGLGFGVLILPSGDIFSEAWRPDGISYSDDLEALAIRNKLHAESIHTIDAQVFGLCQ